jgi:hypothetical protein
MMRYVLALVLCLMAGYPASARSPYDFEKPPQIKLQGGCITPAAPNENIRLDLMQVTIRLKRDSYLVDAVFHLFNTGDTAKEMVGVLKFGYADERVWDGIPPVYDFLRFNAWIDGRKTEFVEVRQFLRDPDSAFCDDVSSGGISETRWMVKEVTFAGHSLTVISVRYEALYKHPLSTSFNQYFGGFYYWMGRYWKGKIRKAVFIIDNTDICGHEGSGHIDTSYVGPRRAFTERIQRYEMVEFEPPLCETLPFSRFASRTESKR